MASRYNDSHGKVNKPGDFVVRRQKPSLLVIALFYLAALLLALAAIALNLDKVALIGTLFVLLGAHGSYMIVLLQRSRDFVLTTEFQNSLFAAALDYNQAFCLIVKKDGAIVYKDRLFQKMFPGFSKDTYLSLPGFLEYAKVSESEQGEIFDSIARGTGDKVAFTVYPEGRAQKLVLSVEPIRRPPGYATLRAREYIEKRSEKAEDLISKPETLLMSQSRLRQFSELMNHINVGLYVVDPAGKIIHTNATLEYWLQLNKNDVDSGKYTLKDIAQYEEKHAGSMSPDNYEGEIVLKKKEGGLVRSFINQKVFLADDKRRLGCLGLVQNIENNPAVKIRLW